jgi:potassium/hydrogen antiporter
MFLSLGLLVNPHEMLSIAIPATLIGIFMIVLARPLSVLLCLLPFKKMNINSRLFISWVGLRGAVPIIFATYPVVADVPGSTQIFNIVFFITILSLVVQGTTISWMAKLLHLDTPLEKTGNDFGVEIPEEINTDLRDIVLTEEMLAKGNRLMDMNLPFTVFLQVGLTSSKRVMGKYANSRWSSFVLYTIAVIVSALNIMLLLS